MAWNIFSPLQQLTQIASQQNAKKTGTPAQQVQQATDQWTQQTAQKAYKPETITAAKPENSGAPAPGMQSIDSEAGNTTPYKGQFNYQQDNSEDEKKLQETTQHQNYQPITSNFAGLGAYIGANTQNVGKTLNAYYQGTQGAGQTEGESKLDASIAMQGRAMHGGKDEAQRAQETATKLASSFSTPEAVKAYTDEAAASGLSKDQYESNLRDRIARNQAEADRIDRAGRVSSMLLSGDVGGLAGERFNAVDSRDYQNAQKGIVKGTTAQLMSGIRGELDTRLGQQESAANAAKDANLAAAQNPAIRAALNQALALQGKKPLADNTPISFTQDTYKQYASDIDKALAQANKDLKKLQSESKVGSYNSADSMAGQATRKGYSSGIKQAQDYIKQLTDTKAQLESLSKESSGAKASRANEDAKLAQIRSVYERMVG